MKCEFYVAISACGKFEVNESEAEAVEYLTDRTDGYQAIRTVKLSLEIETPSPVNLSATIPACVTSEIVKMEISTPTGV